MRDQLARVRRGGLRLEHLEDRSLLSATPFDFVDPVEYVDLGIYDVEIASSEIVVEDGDYVVMDYMAEGDYVGEEWMWASFSSEGEVYDFEGEVYEVYDFGGEDYELPMEAWCFTPVEGEVWPCFVGVGEFGEVPLEPIEGDVEWSDSWAYRNLLPTEFEGEATVFETASADVPLSFLSGETPAEVVDPAVGYEPFLAYSLPPVEVAVTPPAEVTAETEADFSAFALLTAGVETAAFAETPKAEAEAVAVVDEKVSYDAPAAQPKSVDVAGVAEATEPVSGLTVELGQSI